MSDGDGQQPASWKTIRDAVPVLAADEVQVGTVLEVLALESADIFHGLVVQTAAPTHSVLVSAENVRAITGNSVSIGLSSDQFRALEPYQESQSYHLGLVGLFRRRPGWVPEGHDPE